MANMLYNGVELPDIESVWTEELKATYPYGYIYKNSGFAGGYGLNCSTYPVRINNGLIWTAGGSRYLQFGLNSAGEWEQRGTVTVNSDKGIFSSTAYPVIWAGFDIIDRNDSTVYLSASDPLPVGKPITDPLSFMMGCNWMKAMLAKRGRKPIGYSYNGVVLPELPEWDRETYPYAVIKLGNAFIAYRNHVQLLVFEEIDFTNGALQYDKNCLKTASADYTAEDFEWGELTQSTSVGNIASIYLLWANTDIYYPEDYEDTDLAGTIYLAASEPIPVYEGGA